MLIPQYKLKESARQFFDKSLHTDVKEKTYWTENGIHENLLEEVPNVFVKYGDFKPGSLGSSLSGFEHHKEMGHINFSIHFRNMDYQSYDKLRIAEIMDKVQKVVNQFVNQ